MEETKNEIRCTYSKIRVNGQYIRMLKEPDGTVRFTKVGRNSWTEPACSQAQAVARGEDPC